jgi:ubiquinone/menaquinone biosynthesis C-methylase UbiE
MNNKNHIPNVWEEEIYGQGQHLNRYPFDNIVTFIYRNYPRDKERHDVKVLEVGCGSGNNLWFAAREGFSVTGIDGSKSAINYVKDRFKNENLEGTFIVGDFTMLPFKDEQFDIVIDRGSIVCVNLDGAKKAISEVARVLKHEGLFFLNLYSDRHSSYLSGILQNDGFTTDIKDGSLKGVGSLCFYGRKEIDYILKDLWYIQSIKHKTFDEYVNAKITTHTEWEIVLRKK